MIDRNRKIGKLITKEPGLDCIFYSLHLHWPCDLFCLKRCCMKFRAQASKDPAPFAFVLIDASQKFSCKMPVSLPGRCKSMRPRTETLQPRVNITNQTWERSHRGPFIFCWATSWMHELAHVKPSEELPSQLTDSWKIVNHAVVSR